MITEIFKIVILSLSSIIILFFLTKLMGNREMSQLTLFDYVNSITIGSIAAEMSTSLDQNYLEPLTAMIVYAIIITLVAFLSSKSIKFRHFVSGKSLVLYENGNLYRENFKKAKLDLSEFLSQCRINGYFYLSDLQSVILESNGRLSFLPQSSKRAATPEDLSLNPTAQKPLSSVILDGKVMKNNLKATGNNLKWLNSQLKKQGIKDIQDIFLATCDTYNNLSIYIKLPKKTSNTIFE